MKLRVVSMAVAGVLACSVAAWAAVCPICLKQIPEGDKFCSRHQQEQLAKVVNATEEAKLAADLEKARAEYQQKLETLQKFYSDRGNAKGLSDIETELNGLTGTKHFGYANWEDTLGEISASEDNTEAATLLAQADVLRKKLNPKGKAQRITDAAVMYRDIVMKYPKSKSVEPALYNLGDIYSSGAVKDYARAVKFYELCYLSNPSTSRNALIRAAQVSESDLGLYENAAKYYWMAAQTSSSAIDRKKAELKLKGLQKGGFGKDYTLEAQPEAKKDDKPAK